MTPSARVAAANVVLDDILGGRSAEQALSAWGRTSRFAGSKDRAALRDLVYDALRRRSSCAALGGGLHGRGLMVGLGIADGWDMAALFCGDGHGAAPLSVTEQALCAHPVTLDPVQTYDLPEWLWPIWLTDLGDAAAPAAAALRARAPLYLRVNSRRAGGDAARDALAADGIVTTPHPTQPGCLRVTENPRRVKGSAAYRDGVVEVQDAASQIAIAHLTVAPGARVLDYCAGGGGKALALADRVACDIVAHDVSPARMQDIPHRASRAGVVITVCQTDALPQEAPFDVVLVDAPCSGSGTWARNPEAKWALTVEKLRDFSNLQADVLAKAAGFVKPGGRLVYMTCSVFRAENDAVVAAFLDQHPQWTAADPLRLVPGPTFDGFFCQVLACP